MPQTQFTLDEERKRLEDTHRTLGRLNDFWRPYRSRWSELFRQLIGFSERRTYPDGTPRANIFIPYPLANWRHVGASVTEALFGMDPPFECLPMGSRDTEAAYRMQPVMEVLALRKAKLRTAIHDFVGVLSTYGIAAMDFSWDFDFDLVYDWADKPVTPTATTPPQLIGMEPISGRPLVIDPMTGQPAIQRVRVLTPVPRNRPKYEVLDIYDTLIDPDGATIVRFYDKTIPQMMRENLGAQQAGFQLYSEEALHELDIHLRNQANGEEDMNALIRIAAIWNAVDGTFSMRTVEPDSEALTYKDERYTKRSATYAQFRRPLLKGAPQKMLATGFNPYNHCRVPILWTNYTKLPGEISGMGVIEPSYNLVESLNKAFSMVFDKWNLGINQRFAFDGSGGTDVDMDDLQNLNVPGGLVKVYGNPQNVLYPLPVEGPNGQDYSILVPLQNAIEVASNVSDAFHRGVGGTQGNKTATGISSVLQETNKTSTQLVLRLTEDILEPGLQMTASNIQQFITDELEVRITDELPAIPKQNSQFLMIKPSEIAGNFDFRIVGAAYMENRFVLQNNARMLVQILAGSPYLREAETIEELFRLHRIPYPKRFIKTEEEVQMEQVMMMQQQLLLAAMTGQNPQVAQGGGQGGRKGPGSQGTPKRPQATVDSVTGATRGYAQQNGANMMGQGGRGELPSG